MRFSLWSVLILVVFSLDAIAQDDKIELSGVYKGKSLYVQNPFAGDMGKFCTKDVFVNGEKKMSNIQSSAFEIDLSFLKMGDPLVIKITHSKVCKPKILNPQVVRNNSNNFHFLAFNVSNSKLNWSSKGESGGCKMFVQQFTRGQWMNVKEVKGKGLPSKSDYNVSITHHNGLNKYRVKYLDVHGKVVYSHINEFNSAESDVTFYPSRVSTKITLSRSIDFEIMDSYGNIVKKGKGEKIDCMDLKTGVYYLNMHNQTEKFFKK